MAPPPIVTGLSPNEGPPGTKIIIRGENFGTKPTDLIGLTICGCDCLLSAEWKSPNKIIARSGPGKGKGEVIVTTRSGGVGSCNVTFKGYHETVGPMKESAVWVEKTPLFVWGRNSLSSNTFQQEDPLGLSEEGNEKKISEDDLMELFPNLSGDIISENFSPGWFLLENHQCTSFNDLQAGLLHLRRKVENQKEGQLSFLKANVGSVMDQIDTMDRLKQSFENDVLKYGTEPTHKLEKSIKESVREARKLFDDVLSRRDRAEKTRNALNVLSRFKFLFCLPCIIDRHMQKQDYDIIINDYMRVKNLFNRTEVPVFKTALYETEKRIMALQKMLHDNLQKMPISIEEQKRLIRYLINLDAPCEPAWDAIQSHVNYINLRFKECYDEHKSAEAVLAQELSKLKNSHSSSKFNKYNIQAQDTLHFIPENVLFIEDLCDILSQLFPNLWKLGHSYFTGELLHVKIEPGKQVAFKHIVLTIIETFCKMLRAAVIPHTLDRNVDKSTVGSWSVKDINIIAPWLPNILRHVRSSYNILIKLDLPNEALNIISDLILDLKIFCMSVLFKQATELVRQLQKQEDWKIEFNGVTGLPLKYEQHLQNVIQLVKESVLINEQKEISLSESPVAQKELEKNVESLFLVFYDVLKNLTFQNENGEEEGCTAVVSQLIGTPVSAYRNYGSTKEVLLWEHKLLKVLANCQYMTSIVLDNIFEIFDKSGIALSKASIEKIQNKFSVLEKTVLETYLEQKSDPLVGTIEPSMYLGKFDWDCVNIVADIKPYAKECLNNVIHVHSEVYGVSPTLVDNILPQVIQTVAEELYRLMSCVQKFNLYGIQQARADIGFLQSMFSSYLTPKASTFFKEALDAIPTLKDGEQTIVEDVIAKSSKKMKLQALCLIKAENNITL